MQLIKEDIPLKAIIACFIASLFSFYDLFQLSLFNSIAANLAVSFHLSSTKLGFLSSAYLWANALGLIPLGVLIDRYTVRFVAITMLSISVFACFVIATSHSWQVVMAMRFLQGLTSATSLLTCMRMAIRWFGSRANTAIGLMIAIALLGGVFGNDIFIKIVNNIGWRYSITLAGFIGTLILLLMIIFLFEKKITVANTKTLYQNNWFQNVISAAKNYHNLLLGAYLGLMSLPIFIFAALWGNLFIKQHYNINTSEAGFITSLLFTGLLIGAPFVGYITDKLRNPLFIMKTGAVCSLILILPFLFKVPLTHLQMILLFLMLGMIGSMQNVTYVVIADINNPFILSTATAIASFIENIIGAIGQMLFGWLLSASWQNISSEQISISMQHNYVNAILIFPIAFLLCLSLLLFSFKKTSAS